MAWKQVISLTQVERWRLLESPTLRVFSKQFNIGKSVSLDGRTCKHPVIDRYVRLRPGPRQAEEASARKVKGLAENKFKKSLHRDLSNSKKLDENIIGCPLCELGSNPQKRGVLGSEKRPIHVIIHEGGLGTQKTPMYVIRKVIVGVLEVVVRIVLVILVLAFYERKFRVGFSFSCNMKYFMKKFAHMVFNSLQQLSIS